MIKKVHETKKKRTHFLLVKKVREDWAVRVFLQVTYEKTLKNNWPLPTNVFRVNSMSHDRFFYLHYL